MAIHVFIRSQLDMLGVHPAVFDKEAVCRATRGTRLGLVQRSSSPVDRI